MRQIGVSQVVQVSLKEEAFTDDFMSEFRKSFFDFKTIEDHAEHIAQLVARGLIDTGFFEKQFVEGYGELGEFVKSIRLRDCETQTLSV